MKKRCGEAGDCRLYFRGQKFSREEAQVNREPETANACSSTWPNLCLCSLELASDFCPLLTHTVMQAQPKFHYIHDWDMHRCTQTFLRTHNCVVHQNIQKTCHQTKRAIIIQTYANPVFFFFCQCLCLCNVHLGTSGSKSCLNIIIIISFDMSTMSPDAELN